MEGKGTAKTSGEATTEEVLLRDRVANSGAAESRDNRPWDPEKGPQKRVERKNHVHRGETPHQANHDPESESPLRSVYITTVWEIPLTREIG